MLDIKKFINKRTLIVGDVNSGKTQYTLSIIEEFLKNGINDIAIMDLAPETVKNIGGKMVPPDHPGILYVTTGIAAPRLTGKDEEEIMMLARKNAESIETLFDEYLLKPRQHLFVNDVTLYLHAGTLERLNEILSTAATQIINAYRGTTLHDNLLSRRETLLVDLLIEGCDNLISL